MGVSLERVQFKFASIIGELCSEPDVLSQFAVWLDLRLAEYKLKGAISLDCSGEEPDPIWLKGLNKTKKNSVGQRESSLHSSSPSLSRHGQLSSHHSESQSTSRDISESHSQSALSAGALDRLSPDVVVVKDEPSDVYPVGLHVHENMDSSFMARRKRPAAETMSSEHWSHDRSSTSPKHRRISSAAESPSNQSLMSVIGGFQGDKQASDNKGDNSVLPSSSAPVMSSPMAARSSVDLQGDLTADFSDTSLNNSQSLQDIGWMSQPGMSGDGSTLNANAGDSHRRNSTSEDPLKSLERRNLGNRCRLMKVDPERLAKIAAQTATNMAAAVGTFERWLWKRYNQEQRSITEIPPIELDSYLTTFYSTVVTPSGADYKPDSFYALRNFLRRYLKETNYPEDLKTSLLFRNSDEAFQVRKKQLM